MAVSAGGVGAWRRATHAQEGKEGAFFGVSLLYPHMPGARENVWLVAQVGWASAVEPVGMRAVDGRVGGAVHEQHGARDPAKQRESSGRECLHVKQELRSTSHLRIRLRLGKGSQSE